jgi:hypothetical protein
MNGIAPQKLMCMALYGTEEGLARTVWMKIGWFWMVKCQFTYNISKVIMNMQTVLLVHLYQPGNIDE